MKPRDQIGKARNARINQAVRHAEELDARTELESLTQCVHEANAYNNAIQPRGPTAKPSDFDSENAGSSPAEVANP